MTSAIRGPLLGPEIFVYARLPAAMLIPSQSTFWNERYEDLLSQADGVLEHKEGEMHLTLAATANAAIVEARATASSAATQAES